MVQPHVSHAMPTSMAAVRMIQKQVAEEVAMQVDSEEDLNQYFELSAFNPMQRMRNFKELDELKSSLSEKEEAEESQETKGLSSLSSEKLEEAASKFQRNNPELNNKTLLILRSKITAQDTPEEILKKVMEVYPDPALADEALDFLIETADPKTASNLAQAKAQLNENFGREIKAGRNIGAQAREFSKEGLGSPTSLRDMYRDITGTPRDPLVLFNELTEKFQYQKMKSAIHFMLHSLGQDLKSKGPSIPRPELKRLIDDIRSLQGILGVFRFFQSRMKLIERLFSSYHLSFPKRIDFELLSKLFIKLLAEKFVNPEKIRSLAKLLQVEDEIAAQIILYTQMRDGLKQISPRYFRNPNHRDQLWKAYIDTIEELEDKLEDEEENEEK